jgi:tetratricopeptide (TPR) repeat protein
MATDRIVGELAAAGVDIDVTAFGELARSHISAWALSQTWRTSAFADPEFVGLAACELWRRCVPERPSLEMLDELMQEGYDALERGDAPGACQTWIRMWDALLAVLPPEVGLVDQADALFPGLNTPGNHLGDMQVELHNAALDNADIARQSADLYARLAERFAACPQANLLRRDLAEFLNTAGEQRKAEAILQQLIAEDPDDAAAYAVLADLLSRQRAGAEYRDVKRAIELLERALDRPVRNADAWDLLPRLEDLRRKARSAATST